MTECFVLVVECTHHGAVICRGHCDCFCVFFFFFFFAHCGVFVFVVRDFEGGCDFLR